VRRPRSLRSRLLLGALVWVIAASIAGGWALSYAFRSAARNAFDARLSSFVAVLIGQIDVQPDGQLSLARAIGDPQFEQVYSGWYWLASDRINPPLRSRSLWDLSLDVPNVPVAATPTLFAARDPLGREIRIAAQRVVLPGASTPITFVVTGDAEALRTEIQHFDLVLRIALGALGLGLILAVLVQIRFGLRPLERLAAEVQAVRTGQSDRLPALETAELDGVVAEVNSLIEHNQRIVERARSSASDLAHALKTPLAVLKTLNDDDASAAQERALQLGAMERIVTRHLARASAAGPGRRAALPIAPIVDEIARGLALVHAERHLQIDNEVRNTTRYPADREDLEELLGNLIENACKWATRRVRVRDREENDRLIIVVEDDGPGMPPEQAQHATDRGVRFDERAPGSGLGLAIVTDLVALYEGELTLSRADLGGVRAQVALPLRR
jgi:signal transduction histidine kinase